MDPTRNGSTARPTAGNASVGFENVSDVDAQAVCQDNRLSLDEKQRRHRLAVQMGQKMKRQELGAKQTSPARNPGGKHQASDTPKVAARSQAILQTAEAEEGEQSDSSLDFSEQIKLPGVTPLKPGIEGVHDALKMLESSKVLGAPGLMVCAAAFGTPPDSDADAEVSEKVAGVLALEGNDSAMTPEVAARSLMFTSPQRTAGGALLTPGTPAWNRAKDALEAEMALLQQQLAEPSPGGAPKAERDAVETELARVREQIERLHNPGATPEGGGGRWTSKKDRLKAELSRMRAQLQVAKQARQTMAQVDHPDEDGGGAADVKAELSAMVSKVDAAHGGDEAWLAVEQERLKTELMGQLDKLDAAAPRSGRKATQVPRSDLCLSPGAAEAEATILAARVGNSEVGRGGLSESRTRSSQVRSTQDKLPTLQRPVSDSTRLPSGQVDQGGWGVLAAWRGPGGDDLEANPSDPSPDGCRARAEAAVELLEKTAVAGAASAVLLLVFGIFAPWGFPVWAVALPLAGAYALLRFLNLLPAVLAEDGAPPRALALLSYFLVGIGCLLFAAFILSASASLAVAPLLTTRACIDLPAGYAAEVGGTLLPIVPVAGAVNASANASAADAANGTAVANATRRVMLGQLQNDVDLTLEKMLARCEAWNMCSETGAKMATCSAMHGMNVWNALIFFVASCLLPFFVLWLNHTITTRIAEYERAKADGECRPADTHPATLLSLAFNDWELFSVTVLGFPPPARGSLKRQGSQDSASGEERVTSAEARAREEAARDELEFGITPEVRH